MDINDNLLIVLINLLPAPREEKIPKGSVPRSMENEGFYVGTPPVIEQTSVSVMENRVLMSKKEVILIYFLPTYCNNGKELYDNDL